MRFPSIAGRSAAHESNRDVDRMVPAVSVSITFMRGRSTGNAWETHLNERFPRLNMSRCRASGVELKTFPSTAAATVFPPRRSVVRPGVQSPRGEGA